MNRMTAFKTELGEHSASCSIASNGYSRLKRRPRMCRWLAFVITAGILSTPLVARAQVTRDPLELVVATENGEVRGSRVEGVDKFLAIPYAAPPTGVLRWKPPAAANNWSGVRDATRFGSACAQAEGGNGPQVLDEDCLFVNVFRPARTTEQSKLPVYFFIHGGGNTSGSSIQHDATKFAQDNRLIIVTLNYRLGVFGFLGLPSLRAESTDNASGNYALMDQQAAMRWIQRNIAKFGGDPQRVTMAGESAGASAVCMHLTSPTARGLFMRGVMQSGNCFATPLDTLETSGSKYAAAAGCADAATAAQCLRSKSSLDLIQTAASTTVITQPVIAGNLLPQAPFEAIRAGTWNKVPMIIGANHDEQRIFLFLGIGGKLPVSDTGYAEQVRTLFGANAERVLAAYPLKDYPNASIALSTVLDGYVGRSCRSIAMVDEFSKTASVWHFEFNDQTAPPQFPRPDYFPIAAAHAHELQYFFAFDSTAPLVGPQVTLSKQMQAYWTAFAATGDPGSAGGPVWPHWVPAKHETVSLQTGGNTIRTNASDDHKCALWTSLGFGLP